jgi:SAM-dependent methyltransferase
MTPRHRQSHLACTASDPLVDTSPTDRWLAIGAVEKARSVIELVNDRPIRHVLEVGAGTGAILHELDRAGFGEEYWACEPSSRLYEQLVRKDIARLAGAYGTTLEDSPLVERDFDLVILSHVLEHVVAPAPLLANCLNLAPLVLLEVPLEANPAGRLRSALRRRPRWPNVSGHVHFFSQRSANELVTLAGGQVTGRRIYFPLASYEHQASDPLRRAIARAARLFPALACSYHAHLALLVSRRRINIAEANGEYFNP